MKNSLTDRGISLPGTLHQVALLFVILATIASSASAQNNIPGQVSPSDPLPEVFFPLSGVVTNIQGDVIELGGNLSLDISRALVNTLAFNIVPASAIKIGMIVKAFAKPGATLEAPLIAFGVAIQLENEVYFSGFIQEIDVVSQTITVLNQKVKITGATVFRTEEGFKTARTFVKFREKEVIEITAMYQGTDLIATSVIQRLRPRPRPAQ